MLLKPWRNIATDLKLSMETWESAFETFLATASRKVRHIISGIQYFHECENSACRHSVATQSALGRRKPTDTAEQDEDFHLDEDYEGSNGAQVEMNEEGLATLIASQVPWREELHGRLAVKAAKSAKIFQDDDDDTPSWLKGNTTSVINPVATDGLPASEIQPTILGIRNANDNDIRSFLAWKEQMSQDVHKQNAGVNAMHIVAPSQGTVDQGSVSQLSLNQSHNDDRLPTVWYLGENNELAETALAPVDPSMLRYDQFRAYDIVTWHLDQTLAGRKPSPLQMLIHGEGGTGKSKVIQTITEYFVSKSMRHTLLKAAYTGVAASLIDGKTTHSIAMISCSDDATASNETRGKLQVSWRCILYLIIDEMSMISKEFLAKLSHNISIGKMVEGQPASNYSFGRISVIMCGDSHQFPPVAVSPREALYFPSKLHDSASSKLGRATYEEFNTVVVLKEQM